MYIIKNQWGQRQTLRWNWLFLIKKVNPEADPQVAVRLFNVASTQIGSKVQHQEMFKASTPLIEIQAYATSPLSVAAQIIQELKLWELITHTYKALWAIYAGWWLNEEWGHKYFVVWMPRRYNFLGHMKQFSLKSNRCQPMKTIRPAVGKLHCCITEVGLIQCFANSPLTWPNWSFFSNSKVCVQGWTLILGRGWSNRCSWLLAKHPTIWFDIWGLKHFFTLNIFLAGKKKW